jgi:hypothetical protein
LDRLDSGCGATFGGIGVCVTLFDTVDPVTVVVICGTVGAITVPAGAVDGVPANKARFALNAATGAAHNAATATPRRRN